MKEKYENILCEVISFETADVIITSGEDNKYNINQGGVTLS